MIFIANLDKTNSRFMQLEGIVKDEKIKCEYVEDLGYECTSYSYLIADPVIDGLVYLHHPDAPWSAAAEESAEKLAERWEDICDFHSLTPGKVFVGTCFKVLCWRDYGACRAGKVYDASVTDFYGFGTDGFVVGFDENDPDRREADDTYVVSIYVDTIKDAINHFVLA